MATQKLWGNLYICLLDTLYKHSHAPNHTRRNITSTTSRSQTQESKTKQDPKMKTPRSSSGPLPWVTRTNHTQVTQVWGMPRCPQPCCQSTGVAVNRKPLQIANPLYFNHGCTDVRDLEYTKSMPVSVAQ